MDKDFEILKDYSLLLVEDEPKVLDLIGKLLKRRFKEVFLAEDGEKGVELFREFQPDLVISDIQMPNMNGIEMASHILEIKSKVPIIFTTAFEDQFYYDQAASLNIQFFLKKPVELRKLLETSCLSLGLPLL